MIISKIVRVILHNTTIKHYEELGYNIPKHFDQQHYRWQIKRGTYIDVKVEHLTESSHVNVLCQCDHLNCNKQNSIPFKNLKRSLKLNDSKYFCKYHSMQQESFKQKISKTSSLRKIPSGENHPNWNPNKTKEERLLGRSLPGIAKWKKSVKNRDQYTCQKCGFKEYLCVHHKNNFNDFKEQRIDVDNGATLCVDCHHLFHKLYGNRHTTKEQFQEFMKLI